MHPIGLPLPPWTRKLIMADVERFLRDAVIANLRDGHVFPTRVCRRKPHCDFVCFAPRIYKKTGIKFAWEQRQ